LGSGLVNTGLKSGVDPRESFQIVAQSWSDFLACKKRKFSILYIYIYIYIYIWEKKIFYRPKVGVFKIAQL
jgi:hypothetical protein